MFPSCQLPFFSPQGGIFNPPELPFPFSLFLVFSRYCHLFYSNQVKGLRPDPRPAFSSIDPDHTFSPSSSPAIFVRRLMPTPNCSALAGRSIPGGDKCISPTPFHSLHRSLRPRRKEPRLKAAFVLYWAGMDSCSSRTFFFSTFADLGVFCFLDSSGAGFTFCFSSYALASWGRESAPRPHAATALRRGKPS